MSVENLSEKLVATLPEDFLRFPFFYCQCLDPDYEAPEEVCEYPEWKGDGYCDDGNNNENCQWDGGDCCYNFKKGWDKYCDDCQCLDPNPPCHDIFSQQRCQRIKSKGRCNRNWAKAKCLETCEVCTGA